MNEIIQNIITRRSCKSYRSDPVPAELIDQVVEAGLFAASAGGSQSPIILAAANKEDRDEISRLNAKYDPKKRADPFYNAPVVLSVLIPKGQSIAVCDGSLVIGNMLLAAHSLGLGSCWIHRAKDVFEDEDGKALLKKAGITGDWEGVAHCILGYAEKENSQIVPRKDHRVYKL